MSIRWSSRNPPLLVHFGVWVIVFSLLVLLKGATGSPEDAFLEEALGSTPAESHLHPGFVFCFRSEDRDRFRVGMSPSEAHFTIFLAGVFFLVKCAD